jgi:hypothetical protein
MKGWPSFYVSVKIKSQGYRKPKVKDTADLISVSLFHPMGLVCVK